MVLIDEDKLAALFIRQGKGIAAGFCDLRPTFIDIDLNGRIIYLIFFHPYAKYLSCIICLKRTAAR